MRAVDPTMMLSLGTLAVTQARRTEDTKEAVVHLLDYCATTPDEKLRYHARNMTLFIHSNASYLS